ncbi:hypothetical protein KOR42_23350 [Thalassoglobus neptunius]|uniref:Uncharacterized protein n=1 Tax=Thalassoglobus neptunius TaxID=1938619 RepID=A0A5C5X801_9PLAN|nr:hypothetical protein [Thalassoglobus neptunius]TWT58948.1 hypothetical protein KOR42_23350 [Thalassoglobus neptunius]
MRERSETPVFIRYGLEEIDGEQVWIPWSVMTEDATYNANFIREARDIAYHDVGSPYFEIHDVKPGEDLIWYDGETSDCSGKLDVSQIPSECLLDEPLEIMNTGEWNPFKTDDWQCYGDRPTTYCSKCNDQIDDEELCHHLVRMSWGEIGGTGSSEVFESNTREMLQRFAGCLGWEATRRLAAALRRHTYDLQVDSMLDWITFRFSDDQAGAKIVNDAFERWDWDRLAYQDRDEADGVRILSTLWAGYPTYNHQTERVEMEPGGIALTPEEDRKYADWMESVFDDYGIQQ